MRASQTRYAIKDLRNVILAQIILYYD